MQFTSRLTRKRGFVALVAAALGSLVVVGGGAYAVDALTTSSSMIYACQSNTNGSLRVV